MNLSKILETASKGGWTLIGVFALLLVFPFLIVAIILFWPIGRLAEFFEKK